MKTEKIRSACEAAVQAFARLNKKEYTEIKSKLEYCIGSYDYDKNPSGLIEYGQKALDELKAFKARNPRKVNKKIINDLEKSIASLN